ncbi:MAG: AsmA family protein [Rhodocyclaceae bacterium]|nr:AsmA family protein [Rhodocyclaceae bacterium]
MKTLVRVVLGGGVLVLLAAAALFAYLKFVFDPNDFRERLGEATREATGRELVIEGDLGLSVFPWLGVSIGAARLGNAEGFSQQTFASIRSAQVRALLMPLFSGRIEVDRVNLDGLVLNLEVDDGGRTNWADLARSGGGSAGDAASPPDAPEPAAGGGFDPAGLVFGGLSLRDATIRWNDRQSGASYRVQELEVDTGRFATGEPLPLSLKARVMGEQPSLDARLALDATAHLDLAVGRHRLEGLRLEVEATGDALPGRQLAAKLQAEVAADLAQGTLRIDDLALKAYELGLSGALAVEGLETAPQVSGALALAAFNPAQLAGALGVTLPPTRDATVLQRASATLTLAASPNSAAVDELVLVLDDTTARGRVQVSDFTGPSLAFELTVDAFDADRYLPPDAEGKASGSGAGDPPADQPAPAGPLIPPGLVVDGTFSLGRLKVSGLSLSDIRLPVTVKGGQARITPEASLYEGRYQGNIGLDGRGPVPRVGLDETLAGVAIGPLTRDLTGEAPKLTGKASVAAKLALEGLGDAAIRRSLAGTVRLDFANGAVKGVNLAAMMRQAEALLTGQPAPKESGPNETDFTDMKATLQIRDGVARNDDLTMRSPLLRVRGDGSANLVEESVDYLVRTSVVGTLTGQGGKPLEKVKGVTVPVRVRGSFDDPKVALDAQALLEDNFKEKLEEKKQEVKKKAEDKLKQELQKGLQNLFK